MIDLIIVAIVLIILCCAGIYIYKAKKSGKTCIGCPDGGQCKKHKCNCGCSEQIK